MMVGYAAVAAVLFYAGYSISYGHFREPFEQYVAGKILSQQLAVDPENSDLYVFVGDYYYNGDQYEKARDAYENVLRIDPENAHALNNLAWLLATCPKKGLRDPARSLELARRAVSLEPEAHILDTYAEALFLNKRYAEALDAARRALTLASEKKEYYRNQVARFRQLAEGV